MVPTSRDQNPEQDQQQATAAAATGIPLSYAELNALQTIIAIIVCFIICWAPTSVANIVQTLAVCLLLHLMPLFRV